MSKPNDKIKEKNDEFSRIFDEYRAKIEEITRKTEKNLQQAEEPSHNIQETNDEATTIIAEDKKEKANGLVEVNWQPDKEASKIIEDAKRKAQQIIEQAEESVNKEAKKKTQSKVDKIIENARKESEAIIAQTKQAAEKERNEVIAASKIEAEQVIKDITEKYREETQAQSSHLINEARQTAENMLAGIVTSSTEISKLVIDIVNRARNTIDELESNLQAESNDLAKIITETQKKLERIATATVEKNEPKILPPKKPNLPEDDNTLFVKFTGDKSNGQNDTSPLFCGRIELKALSSFEYNQVRSIKNHLINISDIKYVQEYASEKEMSVLFEVKKPLPLLDIFSNLPLVDKVDTEGDGISLTLKKRS